MKDISAETETYKLSIRQACKFNLELIKLFLEHGVDLLEDMRYHGSILDYFFRVLMPSFVHDLPAESDLFDIIYANMRVLLIFGGTPNELSFAPLLDLVARDLRRHLKFVEICANAMNHHRHQKFVTECSGKIPGCQNGQQVKAIGMPFLDKCRSLKQLSRLAVFEASPDKRAAHTMSVL